MRVPVFEYRLLAGSSIARFVGPQKWHHPFTATVKSVCRLSVCVKVCVWVQASGLKGVMAVRVKVTCTCVGWLKVDRQPWTETFAANEVTSGVFPHSSTTLYNTNERERDRQLWREGGREGGCETERGRQDASRETVWHSVRQKDSSRVEVTDMVRIYNLISVETLWLTASSCQPL